MQRLRILQSGLHSNCYRMKAGVGRSNLHKALTGAFLFLLGIAFFLASSHVWAQDVTGSIVGTVVDQTGAAISGASITAKDVNRGTTFTGKTDGSGNFRIERVPIGKYEVRVEASGFQTAVKPAFDLVLNQTARLAFDMQVDRPQRLLRLTLYRRFYRQIPRKSVLISILLPWRICRSSPETITS